MDGKHSGCELCGLQTPLTAARPRKPRKFCDPCLVIRKKELAILAARSPAHAEANRATARRRRGTKNAKNSGSGRYVVRRDAVTKGGTMNPARPAAHIDVGIDALHAWVARHSLHLGFCDHCGTSDRKLEWANKSQQYKRDLSDWLRLCRSCHLKYDNKMGVRNGNKKAIYSGVL
jgi:hypothetical protein